MGVSLSTLLFRARLTHGYSALPTAGTCPVPWGHLFYLPKECYSRSQRWRCRHSSAAERKQKKGSKIILKVMLWRHGIGVNFSPTCWSRGALNNQCPSVCGIPGVAGSWGRGDHSKNILHGDAALSQGENPWNIEISGNKRLLLYHLYIFVSPKINKEKKPLCMMSIISWLFRGRPSIFRVEKMEHFSEEIKALCTEA